MRKVYVPTTAAKPPHVAIEALRVTYTHRPNPEVIPCVFYSIGKSDFDFIEIIRPDESRLYLPKSLIERIECLTEVPA
jgi:hypothetical protein